MKKLLLLSLFALAGYGAWAQAPKKFNYQGVARSTAGAAIANQNIGLRISILDGSATGTAQYVETQTVTTNQFGLYNLQIGAGTAVTGTMNAVTWGSGDKFIKVEIDPAGGSSYTTLGTTQLLSVPYAIYAENSATPGPQGPAGPAGPAGPTGPAGAQGPAGAANANGTTNRLAMFTAPTTLGSTGIIDTNNRLGIGTTNPGATITLNTSDSIQLRASSNYGSQASFGIIRAEYTGSTVANHAGVIGLVAPSTSTATGTGVFGYGGGTGVLGRGVSSTTSTSAQIVGVMGEAYANSGITFGVIGLVNNNGTTTGTKIGVYGEAAGGSANYAGYFWGDVNITGSIAKASGTFKIDHPLDPENKYLYHSFVESPDMMNVYNGNITTDANGVAVVELPSYFEALNKDFRYQLTVIGTFAQAIVGEKVNGNHFTIKTNAPNIEVSWQVTGIRKDAYANAHRIVPEVEKSAEEKGKYLHPVELGKPADQRVISLDYLKQNELKNPVSSKK